VGNIFYLIFAVSIIKNTVMQKTIKLETTYNHHTTKVEVDNSTEFKDFGVEVTRGGRIHQLHIQRFIEDGEEVLKINNNSLSGIELRMFKEFLNQKL
jgi:hypothetical protein